MLIGIIGFIVAWFVASRFLGPRLFGAQIKSDVIGAYNKLPPATQQQVTSQLTPQQRQQLGI